MNTSPTHLHQPLTSSTVLVTLLTGEENWSDGILSAASTGRLIYKEIKNKILLFSRKKSLELERVSIWMVPGLVVLVP